MVSQKAMTYAQAMRDFFYREGKDTLQSFMAELKQLTPEDKEFFRKELERIGYELKEQ